jgi:hypothetical protein
MCERDEAIVTKTCPNPDHDTGMLPLRLLVKHNPFTSNISVEADCFRYLLNLYPAAASIKDGADDSPYDIAVEKNLDSSFIRSLLSTDPTIKTEERRELNYAARREAMFLVFRAMNSSHQPSIWVKFRFKKLDLLQHVVSYL